MERTGDFHDFKRQIVELLPQISTFQQVFLQMIDQTSNASESAALLRVLLLSSYLLLRIGLHSFLPLEDLIDLSLCFIKEQMNNEALLSELLRLLQTLLMVLTRSGELMLNCDLFPYLTRFLTSQTVLQQVSRGDLRIQSWYFVCVDYLSFDPSHSASVSTFPPRDSLLRGLESTEIASIPLGCNCARALLPRQWTWGFGPYPPDAFSCVNKHNDYRNITPTSIKIFPLSLIGNLTGLYLTETDRRSGLLLGGTALMAAERYEAIRKHAQHRLDLSYQRNEKPHGVVGHIAKSEVYGQHKEWKPEKPKPMSSVERREEEEKREIRRRVLRRVAKLEFVNGVEKNYYDSFVRNSDVLLNYVCVLFCFQLVVRGVLESRRVCHARCGGETGEFVRSSVLRVGMRRNAEYHREPVDRCG